MTTRISLRIRDPNPLYRTWIAEWAQLAERDGKESLAASLRTALASIEKYPLPLKTSRECMILEGFGPKICEMLEKRHEKYRKSVVTGSIVPPVEPKATSASQGPGLAGPGPSDTKRLRKTKSDQNLPAATAKPIVPAKRKAAPALDTVLSQPEDVIMSPGSFEVILLVDSMETVGKNKRHVDATIQELNRNGTKYEVRRLNIGDFTWIARDKRGCELVLPHIVERKRLDDLAGSIKSGRYQEQKFRLRNSGIPNITYLIEFLDVKNYGLPIQTLYKAVVNSEVQHDCQVKYTDSAQDTILYLSVQTTLLSELYGQKLLCSCAKDQLPTATVGDHGIDSDMVSLMQFAEFNQAASKWGAVNIKDFFVRQLIQLAQMTIEKAIAITNVYATPRALLSAYEALSGDTDQQMLMLAKIPYGAAKRTIGAALSKVIYEFYHKQTPS